MQRNSMESGPAVVESVDRALRLLTTLSTDGAAGVVDLAREIGVAPSTTHRLLVTLAARGFVVQLADRRYDVGPALLAPGIARRGGSAAEIVRPYLEDLRAACGETCHVLARTGAEVVFVDSVESEQGLRVTSRTGMRMPAWTTSGGKAMIAELGPEESRSLVRGPAAGEAQEPGEPESPGWATALERELRRIRERGYGLNENESEQGVTALGASLGFVAGQHVALTVSLPSARATPELLDRLGRATLEVAGRARAALGTASGTAAGAAGA